MGGGGSVPTNGFLTCSRRAVSVFMGQLFWIMFTTHLGRLPFGSVTTVTSTKVALGPWGTKTYDVSRSSPRTPTVGGAPGWLTDPICRMAEPSARLLARAR